MSLLKQLMQRSPKRINWYPPFMGAGIKVTKVSPSYDEVVVKMRLRWWNRNYVGTHFGGSLYMMVDPFFMMMLMHQLGPGYTVWDKAATIHFMRPGRMTVTAIFNLDTATVGEIRAIVAKEGKMDVTLPVDVVDASGEIVAQASKVVYVRDNAVPHTPRSRGKRFKEPSHDEH